MPGFDGTGPYGRGPFSGKAGGYCILRFDNEPNAAIHGFAGRQAYAVPVPESEVAQLRLRARQLEDTLRELREGIAAFEAQVTQANRTDGQ
ncbi:MAG: DUF5320 domain-containing protein [Candidatus Hydrogenedentota bacterium]